eukprot:gene54112-72319_t
MSDSPFVLAGVMGWPVAHTRSPAIHNHWIARYGLKGAYVQLPVQPDRLEAAIRGLPALGFAGCNVTVPHKVSAMRLMDELHPAARRVAAISRNSAPCAGRLSSNISQVGTSQQRANRTAGSLRAFQPSTSPAGSKRLPGKVSIGARK